jgi:hypothetical protein
MSKYTEEDVHVAWLPGSKHLKNKRNLNFLDWDNPDRFFIDAMESNKDILCLVGMVQRKNHHNIPRYTLDLRAGVRTDNNAIGADFEKLRNYWRMWRLVWPVDSLRLAGMYESMPFGPTRAVLPCTKIIRAPHIHIPADLREPRISISPPYGKEYLNDLNSSVKSQNLADWAHILNLVVQKVYKQFVDENGELV